MNELSLDEKTKICDTQKKTKALEKSRPGKIMLKKTEPEKPDSGKYESGKTEAGKTESLKAKSGKPKSDFESRRPFLKTTNS